MTNRTSAGLQLKDVAQRKVEQLLAGRSYIENHLSTNDSRPVSGRREDDEAFGEYLTSRQHRPCQ